MPRKRSENKIWREQSELILQSAGEGICVMDADGKITFVNEAAARILGGAAQDFAGRRYDEVFFGRKSSAAELAVSPIQFALVEGESAQVNSEVFTRRDGASLSVEYICVPLKRGGEISGAVVTFQDITERRDLETALAEARDAALAAARAKAAFLANMSHEIRTPLNGIVGAADLLMTTDLSEAQNEYAKILKSSARLLLELVGDILDFSKIEAGRLRLDSSEFDLREILAETRNFFETEAAKKNLVLQNEIAENAGDRFVGDRGRLRQILYNLVGNAVKFTARGKISVKVSEENKSNGESLLRFEISDTGIGISAEQKETLFQPFVQGDVSTTRRFGGTGLGLAISRELVEMMGGEIGVESELERGATFWFTVKLVRSQESEIQNADFRATHFSQPIFRSFKSEESGRTSELQSRNFRHRTKILVADDNDASRFVVSEMLRQIGCSVATAANGAEALRLWQTEEFDVVLMDCQMPVADGYAAARKIRELERGARRTKIIALTGSVADGEREKCRRAGMDDYLPKPVSREQLVKILSRSAQDENKLKSLDLPENLRQHLSAYIEKEKLENFLEIESRGNENFVFEMLNLYLENAENLSDELEAALTRRDLLSARKLAHSLKGSSGSAGFGKLTDLFAELEKTLEAENRQAARAVAQKISAEHDKIKKLVAKLKV